MDIKNFLNLIRYKSYLKNLIIFLPLFLSYSSWNFDDFKSLIPIFIFFSFLASSIYIINDLLDLELDKKHIKKKFRPIASGIISIKNSLIISAVLSVFSFIYFVIFANQLVLILVIIYFLINILYSFFLKKIKYLDLLTVLSGFIIRIYIGSSISELSISNFLLIQLITFVLFILICKRREYFYSFNITIQSKYSLIELNFLSKILLVCNILNYFIYLFNDKRFIKSFALEISFLIFFLLMIRYYYINKKNKLFDPISIYFQDMPIIYLSILYILNFIFGFYGLY